MRKKIVALMLVMSLAGGETCFAATVNNHAEIVNTESGAEEIENVPELDEQEKTPEQGEEISDDDTEITPPVEDEKEDEEIEEDLPAEEEGEEVEETEEEEPENPTDKLAAQYRDVLEDGSYFIRSSLSTTRVLDIKNGSVGNKVNIIINASNKANNQKWKVVHDEKGYVTFINEKSGKVLDVALGKNVSGTNVWQYTNNDTLAQKWIVMKSGSLYKVVSALNPELALDVRGGSSKAGTVLQIYHSKDVKAQHFEFIPLDSKMTCEEVIPSGNYFVGTKQDVGYVFDVKGGSDANKANVQLYKANKTFAQAFEFRYEDGYYTIRNLYSNKVLDVAGGGYMPGTNVWQYAGNSSKAQRWIAQKHEDGSYSFISLNNGLALDVAGGKVASGSNIQVYTPNGTEAQRFTLIGADEFYNGIYNIQSAMSTSKVLDVQGGKTNSKTNIQLWGNNSSDAQKWVTEKYEDGTFGILSAKSGLALDVAGGDAVSGTNVWQYTWNRTEAQRWNVRSLGDGTYKICSALDEDLVLSIAKGSAVNGANINIEKWNGAKNQRWLFKKTSCGRKVIHVSITEGSEHVIEKGSSYRLHAKEMFTSGEGSAISWSTSNSSLVSVDSKGLVTGKRAGYATITAKSKTNGNVSSKIRIYVSEKKGELTKQKLDSMNLKGFDKLMIVSHPDDETFWGGGHLMKGKYLVVCITNGHNAVRKTEFNNAMAVSRDKAIILEYPDLSDGDRDNWEYCNVAIKKDIDLLVNYKNWTEIVTHNPDGEYGHVHHKMVDQYTTKICQDSNKFDKLYYFGKFWRTNEIPDGIESNLSTEALLGKHKMINSYTSQMASFESKWKQMEKFEFWIKAENWK